MNRKLFIAILASTTFLFICYVAYSFYRSPVGPPDSFIQTDKECVVQKHAESSDLNSVFEITCGSQSHFIANSEFDLTNYIGKKVTIRASYPKNKSNTDSVKTDKQCIIRNCQLIYKNGTSVYAINILRIEEIK